MDPRTANQIMLIAGVVVVWFILELVIRRGRSKKAMVFDGLIVAIFLVGATLFAGDIPLRVMAVIAGILLMVLLLLAAIFLIRSMGWLFGFRRKWLATRGRHGSRRPTRSCLTPSRRRSSGSRRSGSNASQPPSTKVAPSLPICSALTG